MKKGNKLALCVVSIVTLLYFTLGHLAFAADKAFPNNVRAVHLSLETSSNPAEQMPPEKARQIVTLAQQNGFNTLILLLANATVLQSMPASNHMNSWSAQELVDFVNFARAHGMEVVPEIKLLSKQRMFFSNHYPDFMFDRSTYDPRNEGVYTVVFAAIDEIIQLIHPKAIHIGHDEIDLYAHWTPLMKATSCDYKNVLPAGLFLKDVIKVHDYLNQKDVETWMWGDMLISTDEFPNMQGGLNGGFVGYGATLRKRIPHDIVICDWHYKDTQMNFTTLSTFKQEGFRVIGATNHLDANIRDFSKYAAAHDAEGMIATLWAFPRQNNWPVVTNILQVSGQAFGKDFP